MRTPSAYFQNYYQFGQLDPLHNQLSGFLRNQIFFRVCYFQLTTYIGHFTLIFQEISKNKLRLL